MKAGSAAAVHREPFSPEAAWLRAADLWLQRQLKVESGSNVFPLMHVAAYYTLFSAAIIPGFIESTLLLVIVWVLVIGFNYSLSIGILHLHAHRHLFNQRIPNRILEFLLCFPCGLSYPMMRYVHVHMHHSFDNGPGDLTSTRGFERGWRTVYYWVRYAAICQRATFRGLFAHDAQPVWRNLRTQYLMDTLGTIALVVVLFVWVDMSRTVLFWHVPLLIVFTNIGFFAWLTHAPAFEGKINGSLNTTNRFANLLMHNQGYHLVHHRHPGIHWTQIPNHLDVMLEVDDRLIVPYGVLLPSSWRVALPCKLHDAPHGANWKNRYREKRDSNRLRIPVMPYFGWI
jgi:fatty acid desaturase